MRRIYRTHVLKVEMLYTDTVETRLDSPCFVPSVQTFRIEPPPFLF